MEDLNVKSGILLIRLDNGGIRQVMIKNEVFKNILKYIANSNKNKALYISDKDITSLGDIVEIKEDVQVEDLSMFDLYKNDEGVWMFNGQSFILFTDNVDKAIVKSIEDMDLTKLKKL